METERWEPAIQRPSRFTGRTRVKGLKRNGRTEEVPVRLTTGVRKSETGQGAGCVPGAVFVLLSLVRPRVSGRSSRGED